MQIKSAEEIKQIERGGQILGRILADLVKMCRPGVSTWEIDKAAEAMILRAGGRPSFKGYANKRGEIPFPSAICASLNYELVHGFAKKGVLLSEGDIFSIDVGMEWPHARVSKLVSCNPISKGYFTDTAITMPIGKVPEEVKRLLRVTREALEVGIKAVKPKNSVADIGRAIESYVKSQGKYGIIRDLVGHGVGHEVHEEPRIPNFYDKRLASLPLKPGMVIAIEPMISLGDYKVTTGKDGWVIEMADGSLCAHFEHTVIITKIGRKVATRRPGERMENLVK